MSYTIGEVERLTGIPASTLRYYDKEGLMPAVERAAGGKRLYSEGDLGALEVIGCLKRSGLSIKEIRQFVDWRDAGDETFEQRYAMFCERREAVLAQIAELRRTLDVVEYKCWYYQTAVERGTTEGIHDIPVEDVPPVARAGYDYLLGEARTAQGD